MRAWDPTPPILADSGERRIERRITCRVALPCRHVPLGSRRRPQDPALLALSAVAVSLCAACGSRGLASMDAGADSTPAGPRPLCLFLPYGDPPSAALSTCGAFEASIGSPAPPPPHICRSHQALVLQALCAIQRVAMPPPDAIEAQYSNLMALTAFVSSTPPRYVPRFALVISFWNFFPLTGPKRS